MSKVKQAQENCTCKWLTKHKRVRSKDCPIHKSVKVMINIRVDDDVLEWFRKQGKGHTTKMNNVLRMFMQLKKSNAEITVIGPPKFVGGFPNRQEKLISNELINWLL
jgi:uncharacterized protein (DUF4415 family)